jgi:hypothetical protein
VAVWLGVSVRAIGILVRNGHNADIFRRGDKRMLAWAKRYWPALILSALIIATLDGVISSLITCHPIVERSNHGIQSQEQQECTALAGPLLITLVAIVGFLDKHGEAIAAVFTIVLAAFTGRLWWATSKLGQISNATAEAQERDTRILQRAYLGAKPRGLHRTGIGIVAHVAFVNSGNLPARNIRDDVKIAWSSDGDKRDFDEIDLSKSGTFLLLPKSETERGTDRMSGADVVQYQNKTGYMYVWGRVTYEDGFGCSRWMIYCHRYNCANPNIFRQHHHYNDGD